MTVPTSAIAEVWSAGSRNVKNLRVVNLEPSYTVLQSKKKNMFRSPGKHVEASILSKDPHYNVEHFLSTSSRV